jgi:TonB family protein
MRQRQQRRARGFLSRGALISLLLHVNIFGPIMLAAWIYGGDEEAQRNAEVDVAFEDGATANLPEDLPPIEPPPPEPLDAQKPEKEKPEPKKKKIEIAKQAPESKKEAEKQKPKPEPEVVVPPLPPMPPEPPPPPEPRKGHEKMVDLDSGKDVPPPPDAKYLAEKNNRAEVETRAQDTNLERNQKGEGQASEPSEREEPQPGADKQRIADLEDQKSALGRKAPDVTPHENPVVAAPTPEVEQQKKSLLALRDPAPKVHELTPETADLSLPRAADGDLAENRAVRGKKSDPAKLPPGKRVKLALSGEDYEYMFGADAEAERRLAQKQRSMKVGKHLQKLAHMGSALENFIPEVKPGNQTALNTRAAPFAAYIARMHRSIHKLWGFGALEDWDELGSGSPLNNPNLLTTLEIVMNGDGTVDKVTIVKASGYLPYDAAAMDVAYSAGPYPDPPRAIRSKNGKIYVHWRFYRDERQCATSGVDYFILDNAPKGSDQPDGPAVAEAPEPAGAPPRSPSASPPGASGASRGVASPSPGSAGSAAGGPSGAAAPSSPTLGGPPSLAPAPSLLGDPTSPGTTAGSGGLRRLTRSNRTGGGRHAGGMQRLDQEVAAAEAQDAGGHAAPAESAAPARASDPVARAAAERWFAALAAGDTNALAGMASLPFKTSGKEVSKKAQLVAMLADLVDETRGARAHAVQVFTAAGLRAALGKLPPNLEDGSGSQLYAVASSDPHDALILVLGQRSGGWYPIGLVRR